MNLKLSDLDPGEKPTDIGDERARRLRAIGALRDSLAAEAEAAAEAARRTENAASTAVWLGASLADLAAVTGKTRQAARKRWPRLGDVHRRRVWLGNHVDEIRWAVRVLAENESRIKSGDRDLFSEMRALDGRVESAFAESATDPDEPVRRWHDLERLVDVVLRSITDTAVTADGQAEFAVFGAKGVVGYYDRASEKD